MVRRSPIPKSSSGLPPATPGTDLRLPKGTTLPVSLQPSEPLQKSRFFPIRSFKKKSLVGIFVYRSVILCQSEAGQHLLREKGQARLGTTASCVQLMLVCRAQACHEVFFLKTQRIQPLCSLPRAAITKHHNWVASQSWRPQGQVSAGPLSSPALLKACPASSEPLLEASSVGTSSLPSQSLLHMSASLLITPFLLDLGTSLFPL